MSQLYSFPSSSRPIYFLIFLSALNFSLSIPNSPHFGSNLALIGDARFANTTCIQLINPIASSPSSGFLIQKNPIKLLSSSSKSGKPVSFSTDFTFSISPHNGDGLAFLIVPKSFLSRFSSRSSFGVGKETRFLGVEFDTSADKDVRDPNGNHVGVDVDSLVSVRTSNVSSVNLVLNSGMKMRSWVDYDSSSKRIEVRLGKFGSARPYEPLLVYQVDLGDMWRNEEVIVGLSSSSGKSMQVSRVYSWSFKTRSVPKWLHSKPFDPRAFSRKHGDEELAHKKKVCALGFISGLVFMIGCGALLALVVLFLWASFEHSSETVLTMIPGKCNVDSGDFRYEKINVVVEDNLIDSKK